MLVNLQTILKSADENGYAVSAVNKDPQNTQTITLSMIDDQKKEMRIHTVNGPAKDSYNDIDRCEVGITSTDWIPYAETITLAPHSVNVIEIR